MKEQDVTTAASDMMIAELQREAATTWRLLERVPEGELSWAPHPKSMTLGQLALHIAQVPGSIAKLLGELSREIPSVPLPEAKSVGEILSALDNSVKTATERLTSWDESDLMAEWTLTKGGHTVLARPRIDVVRAIMLNHWYHHRGQLTIYLRLLGVPVPSVYGSTADENPFG